MSMQSDIAAVLGNTLPTSEQVLLPYWTELTLQHFGLQRCLLFRPCSSSLKHILSEIHFPLSLGNVGFSFSLIPLIMSLALWHSAYATRSSEAGQMLFVCTDSLMKLRFKRVFNCNQGKHAVKVRRTILMCFLK